jgi:hypothetical protein
MNALSALFPEQFHHPTDHPSDLEPQSAAGIAAPGPRLQTYVVLKRLVWLSWVISVWSYCITFHALRLDRDHIRYLGAVTIPGRSLLGQSLDYLRANLIGISG